MPYQVSEFKGDEQYFINCTGDVVKGDEVKFERATFSGSFRNAKFEGFEMITGKVISESYGHAKQQHTFTLLLEDGSSLKIKGRNLYKNGTYRKQWSDEKSRNFVCQEKHQRGDYFRKIREERYENSFLSC